MTDLENNLNVENLNDESKTDKVEKEEVVVDEVTTSKDVAEPVSVNDNTSATKEETKSENVIASGTGVAKPTEKPALAPVEDGVIGSGKAPVKKSAEPKASASTAKKVEKVALFANRNVVWQGVGKIVKGYNLVDAAAAEKWLTLDGIRKVNPQEVKTALG